MASDPSSPLRIELRSVQNLHDVAPDSVAPITPIPPSGVRSRAGGPARREVRFPGDAGDTWASIPAANGSLARQGAAAEASAFAGLAARWGRPLRVAILSDFVRIPYANGAAFQTRFLYQELRRFGHEVTIIGPDDPEAHPDDLAPGTIALPSVPLKTYPGVHIPLPLASWVYDAGRWNFDLVFAQTTSMLMQFGTWLRRMKGIPLLCVNTTHLVAAYEVLLPERLAHYELVQTGVLAALRGPFERTFAGIYNDSDGLVVLSEGLRTYWQERGVTAPIHVIPRVVPTDNFERPAGADPFDHLTSRGRGSRLLCAGRHTREKSQDRLIRIFARHVAIADPAATLTIIGQGPDTETYKRVARDEGVLGRVFFVGEVPYRLMPDYYAYADVFLHASLSETYGNVLGEALWCGTSTVAYADGMGVSSQIEDGVNGLLFAPGKGRRAELEADAAFGRAVVELLRDPEARASLGRAAARKARSKAHPFVIQKKLADAFLHAHDHMAASGIRPVIDRPKMLQWYTTFQHFKPWTTVMGGLYLSGYLRPSRPIVRSRIHPQIAR
jgi:glycosyltransferase involved in cell wall biosynthesis